MKVKELEKIKIDQRKAEQYKNTLYTEGDMSEYEAYWKGKYPRVSEQVLTVPVLVSDAKRQLASLFGGEPRLEVVARRPDQVASARVKTIIYNEIIRKVRLMDEIVDATQDAITLGTGYIVLGYGSEYGVSADTLVSGVDDTRTDSRGDRIEFNDNVFSDMPWAKRTHTSNIFFPTGTVRSHEAYGYWHRYYRHIDEVREDEKLIKKHRLAINADSRTECDDTADSSVHQREDMVTLFDWYDLRDNHRVTYNPGYPFALSDEVDEILIRIDRLGINPIVFNSNSRMIYGTSDFAMLETLAQEVNDIRTMQMIQRHLQVFKGFFDKRMIEGMLAEDQESFQKAIENLVSDIPGSMIGIEGNPRDFFSGYTPGQQMDMFPQLRLAKDEIREFGAGIGPQQKGQMSEGRHTKYEAQVTEAHHEIFMAPRKRAIQKTILDTVRCWDRLMQDFWVDPKIVEVRDAAGFPVLVEFAGGDLQGNHEFLLSLESMKARSQNEKREEANMILSQSMPFIEMQVVDPVNLYRQYLSRAVGGDWDIDSLMKQRGAPGGAPMPFAQFQRGFMQQQQQQPNVNIAQMLQGQMSQPGSPRPMVTQQRRA